MLNILIAEGTPAVWQAERAGFGLPSNFSLFAAAVRLHCLDVRCTALNIADGEALPFGIAVSDFDGVMFPGSPLHIYDPHPCITRQIDFARAVFAAGVPVWGSCWGLQLAVVALGGSVRRNPRGRELPIARGITVTEAGRTHLLLASRPAVFDALCSHLDEIETLPPNSQVLARRDLLTRLYRRYGARLTRSRYPHHGNEDEIAHRVQYSYSRGTLTSPLLVADRLSRRTTGVTGAIGVSGLSRTGMSEPCCSRGTQI